MPRPKRQGNEDPEYEFKKQLKEKIGKLPYQRKKGEASLKEIQLEKLVKDPVYFAEQILGYNLYSYQKNTLRKSLTIKKILLCWGRQTGKSTLLTLAAIHFAFTHPNSTQLIISPSQRQSVKLTTQIKYIIESTPLLRHSIEKKSWSKTELTFSNGAKIVSLPDSLHTILGYSAHRIYIDEAAQFPSDEIFTRGCQPMILATDGEIWLTSTPRGKRGFFYKKFVEWGESTDAYISLMKSTDSPNINQIELEKQRKTMDELTFAQEYECLFVDDSTSYFPYELIGRCLIQPGDMDFDYPDPFREPNATYYAGIDWARFKDYTVCVIFKEDAKKHLTMVNMIRLRGIDYEDQLKVIIPMLYDYRPKKVIVDRTGGRHDQQFKKLIEMGFNVQPCDFNTEKFDIMSTLQIMFRNGVLSIPDIPVIRSEFRNYQAQLLPSGAIRLGAIGKKHDDIPSAIGMCVYGARRLKHYGKVRSRSAKSRRVTRFSLLK